MVQRMSPEIGRGRARRWSPPTAGLLRTTIAATCLIGLLALALTPALAQDGRGGARQACAADYQRLCAAVSPGGGRIRKCLNDHFDGLSDACKQVVGTPAGK